MKPTTKEPPAIRNRNAVYPDIHGNSLRERVFKLLNKNPNLKPKNIIVLLNDPCITYEQHGETVRQYRKQWKTVYRKGVAPTCPSFHRCRGWIYALESIDRRGVLGKAASVRGTKTGVVGWTLSRNTNRAFIFDCRETLGRLEWFETGRINFWVKAPANFAKVKQLLAYGFQWTGIIKDTQLFDLWVDSKVRFKGAELTVDVGERVPYFKIDTLKESNGVTVLGGDESHPTCIEIPFCYPDWAERNERLLEESKRANADLVAKVNRLTESNISLINTLGVLVAKLQGVDGSSGNEGVFKPMVKGQDYSV